MRNRIVVVLAAVLAVGLAPVASHADRCEDGELLHVYSWLVPTAVSEPAGANLREDLGAEGCRQRTVDTNTNYIAPLTDKIMVVAEVGGPACYPDYKPTSGTIRFDSAPARTLFWSCDASSKWYESQDIDVPPGTATITVRALLQPDDLLEPKRSYSVEYTTTAVM
ncbi:MAG: hypothetical protein WDA27_05855 [Actinomycetota bacterium]